MNNNGIIPIHHHLPLLSDERRIKAFRKAIKNLVKENYIVADLGAGLGILSLISAECGAIVYAVEKDPCVFELGKKITKSYSSKVHYMQGDASTIELPEKADVVICEMIDTALITEEQVIVSNHATNNLLKNTGKIIPNGVRTYAQLIEYDFSINGFSFPVPSMIDHNSPMPLSHLSNMILIDQCNLQKVNYSCRTERRQE